MSFAVLGGSHSLAATGVERFTLITLGLTVASFRIGFLLWKQVSRRP